LAMLAGDLRKGKAVADTAIVANGLLAIRGGKTLYAGKALKAPKGAAATDDGEVTPRALHCRNRLLDFLLSEGEEPVLLRDEGAAQLDYDGVSQVVTPSEGT
jgi:hypothetical protein